jgi:hypothetical protein
VIKILIKISIEICFSQEQYVGIESMKINKCGSQDKIVNEHIKYVGMVSASF